MSTLESVIWHVLGYAAMPVIILSGFVAVARYLYLAVITR